MGEGAKVETGDNGRTYYAPLVVNERKGEGTYIAYKSTEAVKSAYVALPQPSKAASRYSLNKLISTTMPNNQIGGFSIWF